MRKRSWRRRRNRKYVINSAVLTIALVGIALLFGLYYAYTSILVDNDGKYPKTKQVSNERETIHSFQETTENNMDYSFEEESETDFLIIESESGEKINTDKEYDLIDRMSLEDKVAQLFVVTPEALTNVDEVTMAGDTTRIAIEQFPVGGLVYFEGNILSEEQCSEMISNVQTYSISRTGLPMLICTDEEGGTVTRISGRGLENVPEIPSMYEIGEKGSTHDAYSVGYQIGSYLSRFGINVDFAPIADVYSNAQNTVIGVRSFGNSPDLVARMVRNEIAGLKNQGIATTLKHFPGHGDTLADSHYGEAYSYKTLDELRGCEFIPFKAGIEAGADLVMMGHISLPNVLEDNIQASLSYKMVTEILRDELGFEGVIITDALNMGAISNNYNSTEAAVYAIKSGVDMLLMPTDFVAAYNGVLAAINQGIISEERVDQSLARIIHLKMKLKYSNMQRLIDDKLS